MELSFRLSKIAEKVPEGAILADIGTDHAYIPIHLLKNSKIKKAIACDISKGSLEKARLNIKNNELEKFIETRLANGLAKISLEDRVDTLIIAGMGGMLMIDILKNGMEIAKASKTLILQPQKNICELRKFLHQNNFQIQDEEMIIDEKKFYNIIIAKYSQNKQIFTEEEYIFGKANIDRKCTILKKHIIKEMETTENIIKQLKTTNSINRIKELENMIKIYSEVLKCL